MWAGTRLHETTSARVCNEHFLAGGDTRTALLERTSNDLDTVKLLEVPLGYSLRNERTGAGVLALLVDGQDTVADKLGFGGGKVGEHETGAIAESDFVGVVESLEVLGFTGGSGDGDFLGAHEGVDGGGLSDVGVADETDGGLVVVLLAFRIRVWIVG